MHYNLSRKLYLSPSSLTDYALVLVLKNVIVLQSHLQRAVCCLPAASQFWSAKVERIVTITRDFATVIGTHREAECLLLLFLSLWLTWKELDARVILCKLGSVCHCLLDIKGFRSLVFRNAQGSFYRNNRCAHIHDIMFFHNRSTSNQG